MKSRTRATNLSKNVLQMKFMKRSAVAVQEELAEEEQNRQIDSEHWYINVPSHANNESNVTIEQSYTIFNDLQMGRMSFQGFNPEIEKLMLQLTKPEDGEIEDDSDEKDVKDEEMVEYYENNNAACQSIRKKFNGNKRPIFKNFNKNHQFNGSKHKNFDREQHVALKKRKFIKPNLDD